MTADEHYQTICAQYADDCDTPCQQRYECPVNVWIAEHPREARDWAETARRAMH